MKKKPNKKPKPPTACKHHIEIGHCLWCAIAELPKMPKPKKIKVAKKKKEKPAKCDICRRKLIPGDPGDVCMTCRYKMDHDSR